MCFTVNTQLANAAQPTVTTGAATLITTDSAKLNGTLNPNSASTTWYFEYGLTISYGFKTDTLNVGSGTTSVAVSADLLGCLAGTTYHFRLVGTNSAGTVLGGDKIFTTTTVVKPLKPVVTTEAATSVTSTYAKLNGTVNPNGAVTSYYFQYGTTTSYGFTTRNPRSGSERASCAVNKSVTGLSQGTTYHFRIVATNSAGTAYGSDKTFTTITTVTKPTVSNGTASVITATTATLNGTVNPNGSATGSATTCYFKYGTTTSYDKTTASQSIGSGTTAVAVTASITGLLANTTYHFQLFATNGGGTTSGIDKTFTTANTAQEETFTNSLGMIFNLIPAGTFTMGSPADEVGRYSDEGPQHQVTLTNDYYMQTTEVTQGQWKAVMGSNPSYFQNCGDECPVEQVSWEDIKTFITKLNGMGQGTYTLPTEAQWEYAARAGSTTALANGVITVTDCSYDANLDAMGWYCGNSDVTYQGCYDASSWGGPKCAGPHDVAQKDANNFGLYDMHGNVWEWCQDWYGSYSSVAANDPVGPGSGSNRVIRGGSWSYGANRCRSAIRGGNYPSSRFNDLGFRLVCSAGHQ